MNSALSTKTVSRISIFAATAAIAIISCRRGMKRVATEGESITVASFNTLQRGFERKRYASHLPEKIKSWKCRQPLLEKLLPTLGDIIAVQECEIGTFEEDFGFMKDFGFNCIAPFDKSVAKDPSKGSLAKTAMFFNESKFDLQWHNHRSRTLLSAMFDRSSQKLIWIINCHLEGHPDKDAERFSQMKNALNIITKQQKKMNLIPEQCNVIICGDFNCSADSSLVSHVLNGGVEGSHLFKMINTTPKGPTFLGSTGRAQGIDFIFVSNNFTVNTVSPPCTKEQWRDAIEMGLPNEHHPSDHFPLVVNLQI